MTSDTKKAGLVREAARWLGTPFREHTEICGVGADCVHLARAVLVGAGFGLPAIEIADYPLDWAKHRSTSLVLAWLEQSGRFSALPKDAPPEPGDVLCIKQGRCSHHVAVLIAGRQFLHTRVGRFAEYGLIDDPAYAGLLAVSYRHLEAEQP